MSWVAEGVSWEGCCCFCSPSYMCCTILLWKSAPDISSATPCPFSLVWAWAKCVFRHLHNDKHYNNTDSKAEVCKKPTFYWFFYWFVTKLVLPLRSNRHYWSPPSKIHNTLSFPKENIILKRSRVFSSTSGLLVATSVGKLCCSAL